LKIDYRLLKIDFFSGLLFPDVTVTVGCSERFSFVGPAIFPIFSTWQHAQTIRQHHPTAVYWGWRSVFPQFEHKHFHSTTPNTTATANTASLTFMGFAICHIF